VRPFVLHAHFYQPERLNPWTGDLDPEPSAAPDRDWNARITRESYRPNSAARIFDAQRRVERIVNNYERLSFNFGPTLLGWMEQADPDTYARILDGDWRSAVRTGHGNALAQAYNHMILPLANDRDRRTQIRWGLADFTHRFRRAAEGLWLPETAVDQATIDALIDADVGFTVLAPHQAGRVRPNGGSWRTVQGNLDTGRPYRAWHSDGSNRSLAVFFYDGGLAQNLAFDPSTGDAGVLLERIGASGAGHGGLINAALDGETFGHHHKFGELGLAYALFAAAERRGLEPTNYATYLAAHPPVDDVEVANGEGTAWSCAHGVGRWYRDCGCSTSAQHGWNQRWRGPLRDALDMVRDFAAEQFELQGRTLLRDPWAARDDYINVRLGTWTTGAFLDRHARRGLSREQRIDLWTLLEAQRHAMVMYTSCGWFFADISGIETVYVMRSAARVLGLTREACPNADVHGLREKVLDVLAEARSNRSEAGTGADIWRNQVQRSAVIPWRVAADLALQGLVPDGRDPTRGRRVWAGHNVVVTRERNEVRGHVGLTTLRLDLTSLATGRSKRFAVAAVHLGGLDFYGIVADYPGDAAFDAATKEVWDIFPTAPVARLIRSVGERFEGREFALEDALPLGRQELVERIFAELAGHFRLQYARLYSDHQRVLEMLTAAGYELPRDLRAAAELTLAAELEQRLAALDGAPAERDLEAFRSVREILTVARRHGYQLELHAVRLSLSQAFTAAAKRAASTLDAADVDAVARWRAECAELGFELDLSVAQEHAYVAATKARTGRLLASETETVARLGELLALSPVAWRREPRGA
jgi:hypothetical protein